MITALTPNLTLDRTLTLERPLTPGRLHRVSQLTVAAGGKGVNLARAVRAFGGEVQVAGVVGGFNGQRFRHLLEAEGLNSVLEDGEGETRECHILLDGSGHPTEVNEAGFEVTEEVWDRLFARMPTRGVVVSGSLPPHTSPETFRTLLRRLDRPVVDASGKALEAALDAGVALIKPNEHELEALTGSSTLEAASDLFRRTGVTVLLTLGARGAALIGRDILVAEAPRLEARNPVGSGDTLLGTYLWALEQGDTFENALRLAVGAGSANALLGGPLAFRVEVARELALQVRVSVPVLG